MVVNTLYIGRKAKRYRMYQHALFVSCQPWQLAKLCSPRRRKFLFGATNKSSDEDAKKKGACQAHSCINFHHSRCAARCSKTSASSYSQRYICPATLICQTETARGENHYFYFRSFSTLIPFFSLWKASLSCSPCSRTIDWRGYSHLTHMRFHFERKLGLTSLFSPFDRRLDLYVKFGARERSLHRRYHDKKLKVILTPTETP